MTLLIDAGPVLALADPGEPRRKAIAAMLRRERGDLIVPAPVAAEADYLLGARIGRDARRTFLEDLAIGRFSVECLEPDDYSTVLELETRYADLNLGLADCSIVVLAYRYRTRRLLTFDQRCFRAVHPLNGGAFRLLPADG